MAKQIFNKPLKSHFRYGVWNAQDLMVLNCEMSSLRRQDESKNYWWASSFVCDKITQSSNDVILYHIRRKGMKKSDAIMLQSNWPGVEYLFIDGQKEGKCDL